MVGLLKWAKWNEAIVIYENAASFVGQHCHHLKPTCCNSYMCRLATTSMYACLHRCVLVHMCMLAY